MGTVSDHTRLIQGYERHSQLYELWKRVQQGEAGEWEPGIAFQNLILRAFEIEGARVTYPYRVRLFEDSMVEELDGFIELPRSNLMILTECKDLNENISIDSIAKLRNQLARRPSNLIGSVFARQDFTRPAKLLAHFLAPQTILLWSGDDIDFCFRNAYFILGMEEKYRQALLKGMPDHDLSNMNVL